MSALVTQPKHDCGLVRREGMAFQADSTSVGFEQRPAKTRTGVARDTSHLRCKQGLGLSLSCLLNSRPELPA